MGDGPLAIARPCAGQEPIILDAGITDPKILKTTLKIHKDEAVWAAWTTCAGSVKWPRKPEVEELAV